MGVGSGLINLTRQLGGSIGIAAFSTLLTRRQEFHRQSVTAHLNAANPALTQWLARTQTHLQSAGYSAASAHAGAFAQLAAAVERQVSMLSFDDAFFLVTVTFVLFSPLILVFEKPRGSVDTSQAH